MAKRKLSYEGSQIIPVRIPAELLAQIDASVAWSIECKPGEPWTRSSFILDAVREVFRHRAREKKARKARQARKAAERRAQAAQAALAAQGQPEGAE